MGTRLTCARLPEKLDITRLSPCNNATKSSTGTYWLTYSGPGGLPGQRAERVERGKAGGGKARVRAILERGGSGRSRAAPRYPRPSDGLFLFS